MGQRMLTYFILGEINESKECEQKKTRSNYAGSESRGISLNINGQEIIIAIKASFVELPNAPEAEKASL